MKISVIGLGKLGLPFAFFLASHGNKILCYDKNKKILDSIKEKRSPFVEPYLEKLKLSLIVGDYLIIFKIPLKFII